MAGKRKAMGEIERGDRCCRSRDLIGRHGTVPTVRADALYGLFVPAHCTSF